ncbi:2-amino-4-hydroxy-6-hydroxymethyldihydropteridine diphosphokinase [Rhizorhabdus argentea]|uniref:2-amino-4-hydroxy-6- hydroxymethyldihydropteridine diphosphokinase n=1 Tax=Rhizorhabdus argentea TaxID=1387174 RepID=UPI0030ED8F96
MRPYRYAIALGSNRRHGRHGAPAGVVRAAMGVLETAGLALVAESPVISTPALGPAGRGFANAVIIVETLRQPPALLALLKAVEAAFGRRRGRRWGPRVLDLDIVLWSEGRWPRYGGRRLVIPHRSLETRDFVLQPLVRVAPLWRVGSGTRTVRQARARLIRRAG